MSQQFYEPAADTLIACDDAKHFILLDEGSDFCNWVMRRHPDGPLYSIRKATDHELAHARARQHLRHGAAMLEAAPLPPSVSVEPIQRFWCHEASNIRCVRESDYDALSQQLAAVTAERDRLLTMLDTPHTADWFEGVRLEAGHQVKRWGTSHDAGKQPADWFWLIGFLAQKAMTAQMAGNDKKARHHTISTGAAMLNWFRAIVGDSTAMRPGIDDSTLTQQVTKDA